MRYHAYHHSVYLYVLIWYLHFASLTVYLMSAMCRFTELKNWKGKEWGATFRVFDSAGLDTLTYRSLWAWQVIVTCPLVLSCQVLCFDIRCFQSCSQILAIILFGHLRTTTGWKWWKQMCLAKIWLMLVDAGGLQCSRRFQWPWRSRYPDGSRSPVFHWKVLD